MGTWDMHAEEAYAELIRRTREESLLGSCAELLAWDEVTYMPSAGVEHRARQQAVLAGLLHQKATDPRLGELLATAEAGLLASDPTTPVAANLREIRRAYNRQTRLPRALVEETARVTTLAEQEWAESRRLADFSRFLPWLQRVLQLCCRHAEAIDPGRRPYDVLLDEYEPGLTCDAVTELFDGLRRDLIPLATKLTHAARRVEPTRLMGPFPIEKQRVLARQAAMALGFDFGAGRLDTTEHPFISRIGRGDVRLTTRYREDDFFDGFFATLHETGHGLYEQGLPEEHFGTPAGDCPSLALHESQARLWENGVGRSRAFWRYFAPQVERLFPGVLPRLPAETAYVLVNRVEGSLIRITADEVTYNLHVLLRFELERDLVEGQLPVADLPAAWAEASRHHLGVIPANDAEGCLQDGHWGAGMFGYFPTYTLGNVMAAQLHAAACRDLGSVEEAFAQGEFRPLLDWLRHHIHSVGGRYTAATLLERVAGQAPHPAPLLEALRRKYFEIYNV